VGTPSIVSLITGYITALKRWINDIKELGSIEMSEQGKKGGIGAGLFAGAAFFGVFAFGLITFGLVYVLVEVADLATWLSFAIVAVLYLIIAAILALVGKKMVSGLVGPQRTLAAIKSGPGFPLGAEDDEDGPSAAK
jgi:uncharacterized membrane protein YqjE